MSNVHLLGCLLGLTVTVGKVPWESLEGGERVGDRYIGHSHHPAREVFQSPLTGSAVIHPTPPLGGRWRRREDLVLNSLRSQLKVAFLAVLDLLDTGVRSLRDRLVANNTGRGHEGRWVGDSLGNGAESQ